MKNYLFEVVGGNYDNEGERFFICCEEGFVVQTLEDYFPDGIECIELGVYNDDEADLLGYDTL